MRCRIFSIEALFLALLCTFHSPFLPSQMKSIGTSIA